MTDDEAAALYPGDPVLTRINNKTVVCTVNHGIVDQDGVVWILINIPPGIDNTKGWTTIGVHKTLQIPACNILSRYEIDVTKTNILTNILADFLEENGHTDAANLLRKEFPLT